MKSKISRVFALFFFASTLLYQFAKASEPKGTAKLSFSYQIQGDGGSNGSAVIWNPDGRYYMACFAGNADFPLEAFNSAGQNVFEGKVGLDVRGMWLNPKTGNIEVNCAGEKGWYERSVDSKGNPVGEWKLIVSGQNQPDFQSVLSYVPKKKRLVTYHDGYFTYYKRKNQKKKVVVQFGTPFGVKWYINPTTACYTDNKDYPIAILELNAGKILYFSLKGRYLGETLISGTDEIDSFNFSFANGKAFLFDQDARTWNAYDVFE
jgi:hypothetical protein